MIAAGADIHPKVDERPTPVSLTAWENIRTLLLINLGEAVADTSAILPGTLDVLILKAVSLGRLHGYGVLLRIEQISGGALQIQQGALYPALYRLEHQGMLSAEWGTSDNNRKARYYRLTAAGRRMLGEETAQWHRMAQAMGMALAAKPVDA
jgi:transcriptional regulator